MSVMNRGRTHNQTLGAGYVPGYVWVARRIHQARDLGFRGVDLVRTYSNPSDQVERLRPLLDLPRVRRTDDPVGPPKQDQKRLSSDEVADLVAAHHAGTGVKNLAAQFGIHRDTVHNILTRAGALRRRGIQSDDLPEVIRLHRAGWSLAQLATKFGVSPSTMTNTVRRVGVSIRPPERPRA